jgi:hypothetical protein
MQFSQNRREFITLIGGAAAAWPLAARAQQPDRVRRIGVLMGVSEDDPETKARVAAFRWGLERRGWLEGRNLHLDYRFTAARGERLPALAKELVALQPDVILAHSTGAAVELQRESHTIPDRVRQCLGPDRLGLRCEPGAARAAISPACCTS